MSGAQDPSMPSPADIAAADAELAASPPPPLPPRAVDFITRVLAPTMRRKP